ncbi:MAG TPA: adenylate/guanylate cyclase domain-containing protein [Stellaceae bacterium]|nr:adenylate/guanylate cyclase domain-containing protein [Stellaceae bacterium]
MSDASPPPRLRVRALRLDGPVGVKIIDLLVWIVGEGLRGVAAAELFDGLCRRLAAAGVPLWRAFAGMRTLHPQWAGYGYTWRRDIEAVEPSQFPRGAEYEELVLESPFGLLSRQLRAEGAGANPWASLRRRLAGPEAQRDFPILERLAAAGASDYFAESVQFGTEGDPSRGSGVGFSFATDRPEGFAEDDIRLFQSVLPAAALAMMGHAADTIASGLLEAYLGRDAGRRVHAGAVERGSVESIRAVLWYADIRGFTALADRSAGALVVELLDDVFETLAAPLRRRGGEILKFLGDGMLASFPFAEGEQRETCGRALDAAAEAMRALDRLNEARRAAMKPVVAVDLALHLGEVLYGNVGAVGRLDFTLIGPAVNEVARLEALCEPLGARVVVSAELAAACGATRRLRPLGRHPLRGVRHEREVFALDLEAGGTQ